jgi:hypothetical protein
VRGGRGSRKRPRGVQVSPLSPLSVSPRPELLNVQLVVTATPFPPHSSSPYRGLGRDERFAWRGSAADDFRRGPGHHSQATTRKRPLASDHSQATTRGLTRLRPRAERSPSNVWALRSSAQCSGLLYKMHRRHRCKVRRMHRRHRCKVRRNHRNGVPWHPLP